MQKAADVLTAMYNFLVLWRTVQYTYMLTAMHIPAATRYISGVEGIRQPSISWKKKAADMLTDM
jgi:hypothetical protein